MNENKAGGPAFPETSGGRENSETGYLVVGGMTLRDYFAGQALCGMMGGMIEGIMRTARETRMPVLYGFAITAEAAYGYADAMLVEREGEPESAAVPEEREENQ